MAHHLADDNAGTYFGLVGIDVGDTEFVYPRGIRLRRTYVHIMRPSILAFAPAEEGKAHPPPWRTTQDGDSSITATAELFVPCTAAETFEKRIAIAHTISFLLKLWASPQTEIIIASNIAFSEMRFAEDEEAQILEIPVRHGQFRLVAAGTESVERHIESSTENFESTQHLLEESAEFRLMASAFLAGQSHQETSLTMVSLWGALEAIFSPDRGELRFRVSALIAAFLYPPGQERWDRQREISKLYDKRSAAAHGKPNHTGEDLYLTFELVRQVLLQFIGQKRVPTREELEGRLFGKI